MEQILDIPALLDILPDRIKIINENIQLKKENEDYKIQIEQLTQENDALKKENKHHKSQLQNKDFEIKSLKSKNKELKKNFLNMKKSSSQKIFDADTETPSIMKVPLKKSRSVSQRLINEIDKFVDSENKEKEPAKKSTKKSNLKNLQGKKNKFVLFDDYFKDNNQSEEENNNTGNPTELKETVPIISINPLIDNEENQIEDNENQNEDSAKQIEEEFNQLAKENKKVKNLKKKKEKVLPSPQSIPDLIKEIKEADMDQIDSIVTRVLAESFTSLTALKRRYLDLLNNFAVSIKSTSVDTDTIPIVSFFVKFALRISPESLESFKKSVASNQRLTSIISAVEETNGIF